MYLLWLKEVRVFECCSSHRPRVTASSAMSFLGAARSLKRHDAVTRDNTAILARLDNIENLMITLMSKFDKVDHRPQPDDSSRIDRLELLLFRSTISDFSAIDAELASVKCGQATRAEHESSLLDSSISTICTSTSCSPMLFDIFDAGSNIENEDDAIFHAVSRVEHHFSINSLDDDTSTTIMEPKARISSPPDAADLGPIENMGRVAAKSVEAPSMPPSHSKDETKEELLAKMSPECRTIAFALRGMLREVVDDSFRNNAFDSI